MESKKLKKREKQINRQVGENETRTQTRKFQRYKQGALVY
jgi:phage FluMu protein Com